MAEGWLCDSILNTAAQPAPISTAPAFSPGPCSTASPVEGSRRRRALDDLYEQCSDHSTPSIPSSTAFGGRLSWSTITRYSSGVSAQLGLRAALRVGHHPEHVAALVDDARDVVQRAVRIGAGHHAAAGVAVTEYHLAVLFEAREDGGFGEVAAFAVPDGHADHLAFGALRGEGKVGSFNR